MLFPEHAVEILRRAEFDPSATLGYELISGGLSWSDEQHLEFAQACRASGCDYPGYPFAYRTSILVGRPREELRFAWDELKAHCPEWIGFRTERLAPNPEYYQALVEKFEEAF